MFDLDIYATALAVALALAPGGWLASLALRNAGFALAAGGWWAVLAPLLMTWLHLRVSGVVLLEKNIGERRPGYRDYVERTNFFSPGPPRAVRS